MARSPSILSPRAPSVKRPRAPTARNPITQPARTVRRTENINEVRWHNTPQSSWVVGFRYVARTGVMQVWFKSGAVCEYGDIPPTIAARFRQVKSAGKFVWRYLYYLPYKLIRAGRKSKRGSKRRRKR